MLKPRIIPCLLVQGGGLVKTVNFQAPKYLGDPINAVKIFNEKEADELIVLDIDASAKGVAPNLRLIGQFAAECRMPLCYGGGVKSVEHAKAIIGLGVEKVAVSSAAVETPEVIADMAEGIGRQSVVVILDAKRSSRSGAWEVWIHNGRRPTGRALLDMAREAEALGAGEIVVNSVDNDGLMKGYDLELARELRSVLTIPMTVLGGAGSLDDMRRLVEACGVVGAAAGSLFVFKGAFRAVLISYPTASQKEALIHPGAP